MRTERRTAAVVAVAGAAAFVVLAVVLVPWSPVPGGSPEPAPAGEWFSPEHLERAEAYARWARTWSWTSLAVSLGVACWLGFSGLGRRLVARLPGPWWLAAVLAVAALAAAGRLATLPMGLALHRLRVAEGLSTQSTGAWLLDVLRALGVGVVATALAVLVLVGCARRWRRAWPAVAGVVLGGLVLLGSFVYPVVVEPLFHDFEPLPDGPLRTEVLALAEREQVAVEEVLVADASRRTTTLNAYVSGLGSTRRVVLYDTLVDDLPQGQALSVVAHELAHARHDDVLTGSLLGAIGAVTGVGLLGVLLAGRRTGAMDDPRSVPVVLALLALAGFAAAPVQSTISRQIETRADVVALVATGDAESFVAMQRRLSERSLADPTPPAWSQWWFGSHPTVLQRISTALQVSGDDDARGVTAGIVESGAASAGGAVDGGAGVVEQPDDRVLEGEHGDRDQRRDAGDQQAVLHRGRAPVVTVEPGSQHDPHVVQHE